MKPNKDFSLIELTMRDIKNFKPPEPLYAGFPVYKGQVSVLSGDSGSFKSLTAQSEVKSILSGEPLFGRFETCITGPVIYIDEETPQSILKHRLATEGLLPFIGKGLHFFHFPGLRIDNKQWQITLEDTVDRIKPVLCIFDSLTRFHNQDEIKSTHGGMSAVMDVFRKIANNGPHVQIIHHFSKSTRKTTRGSTDIPAAVDIEFNTLKADKIHKRFQLIIGKTRIEEIEPICLRVIGLGGLIKNDTVGIVFDGTLVEELHSEIWKLLKDHGPLPKGSTLTDIKTVSSMLKQRHVKFTVKALDNAINDGVEVGDFKMERVSITRSNGKTYRTTGFSVATTQPSFLMAETGVSLKSSDAIGGKGWRR